MCSNFSRMKLSWIINFHNFTCFYFCGSPLNQNRSLFCFFFIDKSLFADEIKTIRVKRVGTAVLINDPFCLDGLFGHCAKAWPINMRGYKFLDKASNVRNIYIQCIPWKFECIYIYELGYINNIGCDSIHLQCSFFIAYVDCSHYGILYTAVPIIMFHHWNGHLSMSTYFTLKVQHSSNWTYFLWIHEGQQYHIVNVTFYFQVTSFGDQNFASYRVTIN